MKLPKLKETIKNDKKLAVLLVIGVIGVMLLAISEIEAKPENDESGKADIKTVTQETYEKELEKRLEKIVASMEQGDMKLSEMMDKYALGVKLSDICAKSLSRAEKTMDLMVRPNPDGSIDEVAMEDEV